MILTDSQVINIVNALLDYEHIPSIDRVSSLRGGMLQSGAATLPALRPLIERYLTIEDPPRRCQVEHDHWDGKMICGKTLPCARHQR